MHFYSIVPVPPAGIFLVSARKIPKKPTKGCGRAPARHAVPLGSPRPLLIGTEECFGAVITAPKHFTCYRKSAAGGVHRGGRL